MFFHILVLFIAQLQNACIGHQLELQEERIYVKINDGLLRPVFVGNYPLDPPYLYVDESVQSIRSINYETIVEFSKNKLGTNKTKWSQEMKGIIQRATNTIQKVPSTSATSLLSFLHYLRFNRIFEYCNEHVHLGKKCHYFYIDIIGEDNDDGKVSTECFKLLFHNPSPAQRVQENLANEFVIKELNLGILLEQHLKLAKEKIKCVTVEQGIGKMGEKVEAEIGKKCQQWGKKGIDEKRPKDRKRWENEKKVVNGVDHFMQM